jgi:hypothetical protein
MIRAPLWPAPKEGLATNASLNEHKIASCGEGSRSHVKWILKLPNWARWPLVPLGAILGFFVSSAVARFFFWFQSNWIGAGDGAWMTLVSSYVISGGLSGFCFVYAGVYCAPMHKKVVSLILAALIVGMATLSALGLTMNSDWWGLASVIAVIFGAGIAVYSTFEDKVW